MNTSNLKTGDILHCQGRGLIPRLIRWATGSDWSHTAIFVEMWGQPYIIEAQRRGVYPKHYDVWMKRYGYYYKVHRSPIVPDPVIFSKIAMSASGTQYDFWSLLVRQPIRLIFGRWRKKQNESHKFYCSEFAAWCHDITRYEKFTPDDLHSYCMMYGWEVVE